MKNVLILFAAVLLIISSCKDKETPVAVTDIKLSETSRTLAEEETFTLKAIITPEDASDKSIEWDSSNKDAATVADGVVKAVKAGTATITAKSKSNTSVKAECRLTVVAKEVPATAIQIEPATASVLVNETKPLIAIMTPANATDNVKWASSDEKTATVASDGTVKGLVAGKVTITATSTKNPSVKGECQLTVTIKPVPITGLKLTPDKVTLPVDGTRQLVLAIEPKDATESVTYSSKPENIASVSNAGLITAKSGGTAVITVANKDGKITATCTVTVNIPVTSITLGPDQAKVAIGAILTLTVDVKPENASNKTLTWKSSKPDVATVTQEGDKVKVTGLSAGTTIITATAADGSTAADGTAVKGELEVTVPSNKAELLTIALGTEKFSVKVPEQGGTTTVANAPRTISSVLSQVPVTLTVSDSDKATITKGDTEFKSGEAKVVDFSSGDVTFTVKAEDGVTTQSYKVAITPYNAESNPYGVYTAAHLNDVRNDKGGSYKMMNNITLPNRDEAGQTAIGITDDYINKGWLPIAHDATFSGGIPTGAFTGKFDGGNFLIDKLYIKRSTDYIGLFAVVDGATATISNLGVSGSVTSTADGSSKSTGVYVGVLAGYTKGGTISNCYASANLSLENTMANDKYSLYAGGLLGYSGDATINKSYSTGKISGGSVKGASIFVGGFAGTLTETTINDCFATGNCEVTAPKVLPSDLSGPPIEGGGFAANLYESKVTGCYATGNMEVATSGNIKLGGFFARGSLSNYRGTKYSKCYRNSEATFKGNGNVGYSGDDADRRIEGITAKAKNQISAADLGDAWGQDAGKNEGLPYIKGVGIGKGAGN